MANGIVPSPFPDDSIPAVTGTFRTIVSPLISFQPSRWDQMSLNKYVKEEHGNVPVGCVALAAGIIMSYHSWPLCWPASTDIAIRDRYPFDWDAINANHAHDDLCRLMEILGRAQHLNMQYSPEGSGAYMGNLRHTFTEFGFETPTLCAFSSTIAQEQLKQKSPFIMSGTIVEKEPGHAWVIDGLGEYEEPVTDLHGNRITRLYYHFIWGNWGGSNGYYYFAEPNSNNEKGYFEGEPGFLDETDKGDSTPGAPYIATDMVYRFIKDIYSIH